MSEEYTHIRVLKEHSKLIKKVADKNKKSMGEWAYQCVFFMNRHRYDPYEYQDIQLAEEFKRFQKQIVGFIRTMERGVLKTVLDQVNGMSASQKEFSVLFESFLSTNTPVIDDLPPEGGDKTSEQAEKLKQENKRLKLIIKDNEHTFSLQNQALKKIKSASIEHKGKIYVNMDVEEFNKIVSLT